MPDIDLLMQVWPEELETLLGQIELPSAELDVTVVEYVRLICAVLDVPVHGNVIESLHVLFTLFSEFKNNQHFAGIQGGMGMMGGVEGGGEVLSMEATGGGDVGPGGANIMSMETKW